MIAIRRALVVALFIAPIAADAQTTSNWQLCFTGGVLSCTDLSLTTTAQMAGNVRSGTLFDVSLRYTETTSWLSALQSVSFIFATEPTDADVSGPAALIGLTASGGANDGNLAQRWAAHALSSPTDPWSSALVLSGNPAIYGFPPDQTTSWYMGGCGVAAAGGAIDVYTPAALWTCGANAAYFTSFASSATLDADRVTSIGVDAYRAYPGDGAFLAPFCVAQADGSGSIGTAEGDFSDYGDVCSLRETSVMATPEPASIVLFATGLALLVPLARRRRAES